MNKGSVITTAEGINRRAAPVTSIAVSYVDSICFHNDINDSKS